MKIHSIIIFQKTNDIIVYKESYNVSDISFFYRKNIKELLLFMSKTVASRIKNQKICVTEKEYNIYTFDNANYTIVAVTDKEYPSRVAFSMIEYIFQQMSSAFDLDTILQKYKDPNEADQILKVQKTIDSTKIVMLDAIDKVLERGEKLDDLIAEEEKKQHYFYFF